MKSLKLIALTLAVFMAAFPVFAGTNGSLALFSTSGTVEFSEDGTSWKPVLSGQTLASPQKIRTGNGTAQLKFADGTLISMKENSMIDLVQANCDGVKQDSILKLWYGILKAKVTKLQPGSRFEAHTPKVIAAVKGTEFILETTPDASALSVLEGIVALSDILREKEIFVKENERSSFHEGVFETPHDMSPDEVNGLKGGFEAGMLNKKGFGAPSSGREDFSPAELAEMNDLRKDLSDVKDRSNLENKIDMLDQIADVQLGKSLVDMNGYRVRSENYIVRPTNDSIMMLNLTNRDQGPNAGTTSLEVTDKFNKDLPSNFIDVKTAVNNRVGWLDPNNKPAYYYVSETSVLRNPYGDTVLDLVNYKDVKWDTSNSWWDQPFVETFSIDSNAKWTLAKMFDYNSDHHGFWNQYYDETHPNAASTDPNSGGTALGLYKTGTSPTTAQMPYKVENTAPIFNAAGTLIGTKARDVYADNTYLDKSTYLIDDQGQTQDLLALYSQPNFLSLINNYSYELVWTASEFNGRTIDLVVIPQIFDAMTF